MYIDLLIKIKNAQSSGKPILKSPATKFDKAVADILSDRGFIKKVELKGKSYKKYLEIDLEGDRKINGIKFKSKPSLKNYSGYRNLKKVKGGYGTLVLSTPKGIYTDERAKREKVGGQLLFEIW
ncbi:30S ribosomal protein S8 [bacterium]|nr:MAG: 30S ribosomal protein S8 [bacterium]